MADELVIKPFAKAVGSPWNAGTLVCYIEAGLMPLEMLWDYTALLNGIRIFKSKLPSVKLGLKREFFMNTTRAVLIQLLGEKALTAVA